MYSLFITTNIFLHFLVYFYIYLLLGKERELYFTYKRDTLTKNNNLLT